MISVRSLRLPLNGNKIRTVLFLFLLGAMACSASKKTTVVPNKLDPGKVETKDPQVTNADKKKQDEEARKQKYPDLPVFENDFHVAIILPLYLGKELSPATPEYMVQMSVLDYYQGVLLALDSLKKEGINLHLHVYDTQRDSLQTLKVISELENLKLDLVIGPLDPASFKLMSDFSNRNMIPLVAPFSAPDEKDKLNNPYAFFCNPSLKSYGKRLGNAMVKSGKKYNVIYLSDSSYTDLAFYAGLSEVTKTAGLKIKKIRIGGEMNISSHMVRKDSVENIVVIPTDVEARASSVIKSLRGVDTSNITFTVVGLDSWENFKMADFELWNRMNLHVLSNYHQVPDSNYNNFYYQYRQKYEIAPTNLSLRGFDQTLFFGRSLLTFGKYFPKYVQNTEFNAIHNHFFWNFSGNVVQNESVNLLRFYDFRFVRVED